MSSLRRIGLVLFASTLLLNQVACAVFCAPMPPALESVELDSRVESNSKYQGLIHGNIRGLL
jgi:hypothetical protein